ncbi:MAG: hypothetical protein ABFS30_07790 [Pseudomonadota bacterium]
MNPLYTINIEPIHRTGESPEAIPVNPDRLQGFPVLCGRKKRLPWEKGQIQIAALFEGLSAFI